MNEVVGGQTTYKREIVKGKIVEEKKCGPRIQSTKISDSMTMRVGQKAVCSDLANKGTKQECENCPACI